MDAELTGQLKQQLSDVVQLREELEQRNAPGFASRMSLLSIYELESQLRKALAAGAMLNDD